MEDYVVRGIYIFFAAGGVGVLFARGLAYWLDWVPWTVRGVGLGCVTLAVFGVFTQLSVGTGVKALVATTIVCAIYIWQDLGLERKDNEERARKREELLEK